MPFYPDDKQDELVLDKYMQDCSAISLDNLFLKRLEYDAKLRREIAALIERRISNMAIVLRAQWLRDHPQMRLVEVTAARREAWASSRRAVKKDGRTAGRRQRRSSSRPNKRSSMKR